MSIDFSNRRYDTETASYRWHSANDSQIIIYDLKNSAKVGTSLKVNDIACLLCKIGKKKQYVRGMIVGFDFTKAEDGPYVKMVFENDKVIHEISVCAICDWNENGERKAEEYVRKVKQ